MDDFLGCTYCSAYVRWRTNSSAPAHSVGLLVFAYVKKALPPFYLHATKDRCFCDSGCITDTSCFVFDFVWRNLKMSWEFSIYYLPDSRWSDFLMHDQFSEYSVVTSMLCTPAGPLNFPKRHQLVTLFKVLFLLICLHQSSDSSF